MSAASPRSELLLPAIAREIWDAKYRFKSADASVASDETMDDTFWRVARTAASVETGGRKKRERWAGTFAAAMTDLGFLPGGRILAGAGTGRAVTLFNCFVMGRIDDDLSAIFNQVREAALTMQAGGGIGHDFSTLRPRGALVRSIGADASGPVSFMDVWDAMCRTIMSAGARRGAMMATMRCDHPDIDEFISVKADASRLRNFNLSVLVTDPFMAAVRAGTAWDLQFDGRVFRTVAARELWDRLMRAAYDTAEPGVIFIDRVNARNNLDYCEDIHTTNPCGEQPLPEYGACLLGSINLAALVRQPFTAAASIDTVALEARVATAIRLLDNIIDVSAYPLEAQRREAIAKRRIGLGVTGLADALIMLGQRYGSVPACETASGLMRTIQNAAYAASAELARDKGAFPLFDKKKFLSRPNVEALDDRVRGSIEKHGIRNGCLTSIAPTGTISLLAGNVSSGIEPVFDFVFNRRVREASGGTRVETVEDFAHAAYRRAVGETAALPPAFVSMGDLLPADHLAMQAALQPHIDSAISKTINCPEGLSFEAFRDVYGHAYDLGLKGCTAYRPNPVTGSVLSAVEQPAVAEEAAPETVTLPVKVSEPATGQNPAENAAAPQKNAAALAAFGGADVVYMTQPLKRAGVLEGATYKLKWSDSDHAIYITINDTTFESPTANGGTVTRRRPFEIFINSGNLEHYAWTVALTRMISAVFRRGGDVSFVAEELKAIFDPQGGRWVDGRYVPSLLAAIGDVIETHMLKTGFLGPHVTSEIVSAPAVKYGKAGASDSAGPSAAPIKAAAPSRMCPRCSSMSLTRMEGCWTCKNCGFSRCG
jgi:ribonucleoside-diphosphate reductase alpha chain